MNPATTATTEVDEFLADVLPRQQAEERALRGGDPALRLRMWSNNDPVTLLGADGPAGTSGWDGIADRFRSIATRFSDCREYEFELLASGVSGDLAYTVGFERATMSQDGGPVGPVVLRVTHVYRREDGEWKIVHRHADLLRSGNSA